MAQIGNDILPGPVTEVTTADFVGVFPSSQRDTVLLGPADIGSNPEQGNGDAETIYTVVSIAQAEEYFGKESVLTRGCELALGNGAKPVYAIAPAAQNVDAEDIGGSATGTLANSPTSENPANYTITVDSTDQTVELYTEGLPETSPPEGTVYIVPQTGDYDIGTAPSTSATATYDWYDYSEALQEVERVLATLVDFIVPLQENESVAADVQTMVGSLAASEHFSIGLVSAGVALDQANYTQPFDDSRMQVYYPTRDADGQSIIGAIGGKRAYLALSASPIYKSLEGVTALSERLSLADEASLIEERVNPIDSRQSGARIVDDLTTVADTNSDEAGMDTGFARMVMDAVTTLVIENEEPFIGQFNVPSTRNALKGVLITQLENLVRSQDITDYTVDVRERTGRTAAVDVGVETVRGLRNIYNTVTAGIRQSPGEEGA